MTQRTLRIDDEMVRTLCERVFCYDHKPLEQPHLIERARKALEAALSPYLERRKGERRDIKASSPEPTKAEVPTCGGGVEMAYDHGLGEMRPLSTPTPTLYDGYWYRKRSTDGHHMHRHSNHRRASDPTPKGIDTASSGMGQEGNKQNTPTEIHISDAMVEAGKATYPAEIPKDLATVALINEACRRIYRAMESQRLKEQVK